MSVKKQIDRAQKALSKKGTVMPFSKAAGLVFLRLCRDTTAQEAKRRFRGEKLGAYIKPYLELSNTYLEE